MSDIANNLKKAVGGATKKWAKQRRAEERNANAVWRRSTYHCARTAFTHVAGKVIPEAYQLASGNGSLPVSKRQLYYAARERFRQLTGRSIEQKTCDALVLRYMNKNPDKTSSWKITADPRGSLFIPNTAKPARIPCGTIPMDAHMHSVQARPDGEADGIPTLPVEWPSLAAGQRYRAVLYIEKEGFEPLFQQVRLAERYEIAILSCKGQSVVAARKFVDHVCRVNGGVPLFIVHDLDLYGFFIAARLTSVSWEAEEQNRVAYKFKNHINDTDFGLRLEDALKYNLPHEQCKSPDHVDSSLGCTREEADFLLSGRRVELNAFTAPQFIEWIEAKLKAAGLTERMLPEPDVLERAYRRAVATTFLNQQMFALHFTAAEIAEAAVLPNDLTQRVRKLMKKHDEPWDKAICRIVDSAPTTDASRPKRRKK